MNAPLALTAAAALALALALAGCATPGAAPQVCAAGTKPMVSESLYFGTDTPQGPVSAEQWRAFVDAAVTPRFPQGFSVWPASGQWRQASGAIVREPSYVLNVVHAGDAAAAVALAYITDDYKDRFRQEAVMRVRSPVCVSF